MAAELTPSACRSLKSPQRSRLIPTSRDSTIELFSICGSIKAPQRGLEPLTRRLTAGCSTIELLRNMSASASPVNPDPSGLYHLAAAGKSAAAGGGDRTIYRRARGCQANGRGPGFSGEFAVCGKERDGRVADARMIG